MPQVTIYTTPACVYCKMTKEFLRKHNIPYTEKDVASDVKAREEMVQKSGQLGVPVIEVDGQFMIGFDEAQLSELIGLK